MKYELFDKLKFIKQRHYARAPVVPKDTPNQIQECHDKIMSSATHTYTKELKYKV